MLWLLGLFVVLVDVVNRLQNQENIPSTTTKAPYMDFKTNDRNQNVGSVLSNTTNEPQSLDLSILKAISLSTKPPESGNNVTSNISNPTAKGRKMNPIVSYISNTDRTNQQSATTDSTYTKNNSLISSINTTNQLGIPASDRNSSIGRYLINTNIQPNHSLQAIDDENDTRIPNQKDDSTIEEFVVPEPFKLVSSISDIDENKIYRIQSDADGMYLTVTTPEHKEELSKAITLQWSNFETQKWKIKKNNGTFQFISKLLPFNDVTSDSQHVQRLWLLENGEYPGSFKVKTADLSSCLDNNDGIIILQMKCDEATHWVFSAEDTM